MQTVDLSNRLAELHLKPITEKRDKNFGKIVAQDILNSFKTGGTSYFQTRNSKFETLRKFAKGENSMIEFLDFLKIDAKQSFVNLDLEPPKIANAHIERIVQRCMERVEKPSVRAIDQYSIDKKNRTKDEAEFRMRMGDKINEFQAGVETPLEDPEGFTPENTEDLEIWEQTENRLGEEILFEAKSYDVWLDNDGDILKRSALKRLCREGMAAFKVCKYNGVIKIREVKPDNLIYTYSNYDDFRDCTIIGECYKMKISDFRMYYPEVSESKVFELFKKSNQDPKYTQINWLDSYAYSLYRPYDDALIEVFMFELVTTEEDTYVVKRKGNKLNVDKVSAPPVYLGENKSLVNKVRKVIYEGCYVCDEMIKWNIQEDMIKPQDALHEVFTSYVVVMPDQEDLKNVSITERMVFNIRQMIISLLKLQQLKSQLRPDELVVDPTSVTDLDLGLGRVMNAFDVQKIFQQTGVLYRKTIDIDGETRKDDPVKPMPMSSTPAKMQILMEDYNFHLNQLRTYVGTNEIADGQGQDSRLGLGVQNNAINISNRATEFIYDAWITLLKGVYKRINVLLWRDIVKEGKVSVRTVFDIAIDVLPTEAEQAYLEGMTQTALSAGLITFEEAFKVRRYAKVNLKIAENYLSKYEKKRKEQTLIEQQNGAQAAAQQQQISAQQANEFVMQLEQLKGSMKMQSQQLINEGDTNKQLGAFAIEMMKAQVLEGKSLPDEVSEVVKMYFANLAGKQQKQIITDQQAMQPEQPM